MNRATEKKVAVCQRCQQSVGAAPNGTPIGHQCPHFKLCKPLPGATRDVPLCSLCNESKQAARAAGGVR